MVEFELKLKSGNAAFDVDAHGAVADILEDVARKIRAGRIDGTVLDVNGNSVGCFYITEEE